MIADHLHLTPLQGGLLAFLIIGGRYAIVAGGALALVLGNARRIAGRRIQSLSFTREQLAREAGYSLASVAVFAAVAVGMSYVQARWGPFKVYLKPDAHGWAWLFLSFPIVVLIHDFYFYWAHRFMHLPWVFERVHRVHHLSTNPSPLAAFAFHPVETLIEAGVGVLILALMPVNVLVLALWSLYQIVTNVMGHLGYEFFPRGAPRHPVGRWLNTATSHNQHHRAFNANYGLYTVIWDRLFGTLHPGYETLFDRVTARRGRVEPTRPGSRAPAPS